MMLWIRGIGWFGLFVGVALVPLAAAGWTGGAGAPKPFLAEVSVALGFIAFAVTLLQFALVSRLRTSSRPFGTDALTQFHQQMGLVLVILAVAHPLLLAPQGVGAAAWNPVAGVVSTRTGAAATWTIVFIAATSVWQRRLRLSYERWQWLHLALAVAAATFLVVHVRAVRGYSASPLVRNLVAVYAGVFLALALRYRVVRPLLMARRPWSVEENRDIGGSARLLRIRPAGHPGLVFEPGQFAWLATGRHPLWSQQHPLSIASSAERQPGGVVDLAIKNLGDWSGHVVPALARGDRVWLDGPFGAFTIDRPAAAQGFVLIAGGIGIAPLRSMLLTMRDRGDRREVLLVYGAHDLSRVLFATELDEIAGDINLRVVYVLESPPAGWQGATGHITSELLRRNLPRQFTRFQYFVCGPVPMMTALEGVLTSLGVPSGSVHTERFNIS